MKTNHLNYTLSYNNYRGGASFKDGVWQIVYEDENTMLYVEEVFEKEVFPAFVELIVSYCEYLRGLRIERLYKLKYKRFYSGGVGVDLIDSFPKTFTELDKDIKRLNHIERKEEVQRLEDLIRNTKNNETYKLTKERLLKNFTMGE